MREKEPASRAAGAVPPPQLRQYTDPSRPGHQGADLGMNVYPDRAAWLAARAAWAAASGMTVAEWFGAMLEETREAGCTLDQLNMAFSEYLVEHDEFDNELDDPRLR